QPWPTAFTYLHKAGQAPLRLIVYKTAIVAAPASVPPGHLFTDSALPGLLLVAAGPDASGSPTALSILELQPAGKKRMFAADFLRGRAVQPGMFLGPEKP